MQCLFQFFVPLYSWTCLRIAQNNIISDQSKESINDSFLPSPNAFRISIFESPGGDLWLPCLRDTSFYIGFEIHITTTLSVSDFTTPGFKPSRLVCMHCVEKSFECCLRGPKRYCKHRLHNPIAIFDALIENGFVWLICFMHVLLERFYV